MCHEKLKPLIARVLRGVEHLEFPEGGLPNVDYRLKQEIEACLFWSVDQILFACEENMHGLPMRAQ